MTDPLFQAACEAMTKAIHEQPRVWAYLDDDDKRRIIRGVKDVVEIYATDYAEKVHAATRSPKASTAKVDWLRVNRPKGKT